ncbi:MAG: family N-acetyltransferase [Alphaproteobacteria bacterium]|nr:family N-acetyltransferase [Alphaproteobacteria bacterium]
MEMTVIWVRDKLIGWYQRRGYVATGETRPFPYGDDRWGVPTRDDLHFVVLEKLLA